MSSPKTHPRNLLNSSLNHRKDDHVQISASSDAFLDHSSDGEGGPNNFDFGSVTASQNVGNTTVNLNTPNLLLAPTQIAPDGVRSLIVNFEITVDPGQTWQGVVRYDWVLNGVASTTFNNSCIAGCSSQFVHGVGSSLDYSTPFFSPVPVSLTISVINDANVVLGSHTYSFNLAEPVPEPMSLLLLGSGLAMLTGVRAARAYRGRH